MKWHRKISKNTKKTLTKLFGYVIIISVKGGMSELAKGPVLKTGETERCLGSSPVPPPDIQTIYLWRVGRAAECAPLLRVYVRDGIKGSNPLLSAT